MKLRSLLALGVVSLVAGSAFGQASFGVAGYTQDFDSMGTGGTAAPLGWKHFAANFGSNTTWGTTIPTGGANSVATMPITQATTVLTAITTPTANNNNGYNAAISGSALTDRVLATAPTTNAGAFLQLELGNNSGGDLLAGFALTISFDTVRCNAPTTANELPGYWLFASQDGGTTWSNVLANPTISTVPNTVGVTASSLTYTLSSAWLSGTSIHLRWVDDNANQTSPDQIIGLNNVSVLPSPGAAALLGMGVLMGARRRRA